MLFSPYYFFLFFFYWKLKNELNSWLAKGHFKIREQRKIMVYFRISCFSNLSVQAAHRTVSVGMKLVTTSAGSYWWYMGGSCTETLQHNYLSLHSAMWHSNTFQSHTCLENCLYGCMCTYVFAHKHIHFYI